MAYAAQETVTSKVKQVLTEMSKNTYRVLIEHIQVLLFARSHQPTHSKGSYIFYDIKSHILPVLGDDIATKLLRKNAPFNIQKCLGSATSCG